MPVPMKLIVVPLRSESQLTNSTDVSLTAKIVAAGARLAVDGDGPAVAGEPERVAARDGRQGDPVRRNDSRGIARGDVQTGVATQGAHDVVVAGRGAEDEVIVGIEVRVAQPGAEIDAARDGRAGAAGVG